MKVAILCGSVYGTAEEVARHAKQLLTDARCEVYFNTRATLADVQSFAPDALLAVTSTTGWIRRLGRNWARLHTLVYAIGVLAVLHFWWLVKSDIREPALYAGLVALLLGWRIWKRWQPRTFPSARA